MNTAASMKDKKSLYSWREFNVDCFTANPLSLVNSTPARLVNAVVKAMNAVTCKHLPQVILFVPDWDLVKHINFFKSGAKKLFDQIISWIMTNTCRAIQSKKDALAHRHQGAVIASEPKIIWAKMIERVGGEYD